jgi:hypothetical protein
MPSPPILVCGGAGYIGSHMCKALAAAGMVPVTFDNFSTGHRAAVRWGPLVEGDLLDPSSLASAFAAWPVRAVLHFAARSLVGESVREPGLYFRNNVTGTLNLLDAMRDAGVERLVFSSTAAVYGDPVYTPIDEAHPTSPINPYGWSKLMAEREIAEYCRAHGLRAACLRYVNAAGAEYGDHLGQARRSRGHRIARGDVGVGHVHAERGEFARHGALARRDPAGQSDDEAAHASPWRLRSHASACATQSRSPLRGRQPRSRAAAPADATSTAGSPGRRGNRRSGIGAPDTSRHTASTSATDLPCPPPRLNTCTPGTASSRSSASRCASHRSATWM